MMRHFFWILSFLMPIGSLVLSSISLAEEGEWIKKADMPTARRGLGTSVVNGKIYAIGGWDDAQVISTVEEYDPGTDKWTKKADMPTERGFLSTTSTANKKIYAIGGDDKEVAFSAVVEEYDPETNRWTRKANMPTGRFGLSTSVVKGKIYAIGGDGVGDDGISGVLSTVEEYDPQTNRWTRKANMPTKRAFLSTSVVKGKIYAIGGWVPAKPLSTVEEYDPVTDKWIKKADMLTKRAHLSTSVVNGKIYAIGGLWGRSVVEEYDPATDTWTKKADMPTPRSSLSTSVVNREIYAIGGCIDSVPLSTVEVYVPGEPGESINVKGKLPTSWGKIKSTY